MIIKNCPIHGQCYHICLDPVLLRYVCLKCNDAKKKVVK